MSRRLCAALVASLAVLLLIPAGASAHAVLEKTIPARGADPKTQPEQVAFYFNEPVESAFGAVRVYDSSGEEVQTGDVLRPADDGSAVATALKPDLPDGTYTATYRVISADSHPVAGGFVFSIGKPDSGGAPISDLLDKQKGTGGASSPAFVADRWVGYATTALLVGGLAFLVLCWGPAARSRFAEKQGEAERAFGRRLGRVLGIATAVGLLASLLSLPLQISSAAGVSFPDAFTSDYLSEVLSTRYGTVEAFRAGAWLLLGLILLASRVGSRRPAVYAAAIPAAYLLIAPALAGHASTQDPTLLLFPLDVLHVSAMTLWLGGLAALLLAVPAATGALEPGERGGLLLTMLRRFSPVALACVATLAISGTVQAIVEVGSFGDLVDTGFGRAVLIKVALLLGLIGLGYSNRNRLMPALAKRVEDAELAGRTGRRLRDNFRLEVAGIAAVIVAASMMVGYAPPSELDGGPVSGSKTFGDDYLEYTVEPATVGSNQIHLYVFDSQDGSQVDPKEVTAAASLDSAEVGPIELELRKAGPGHYVAQAADFGISGDWTVDVAVRTSAFDQDDVEIDVPIR